MLRFLLVPLLAIGLLATPAEATVLPPGVYRNVDFGSCHVRVLYDNFAQDGYAIMGEYSGSVCGAQTSLRLRWTDGTTVTYTPWCVNWMRFSNPHPGICAFVNLTTQATEYFSTAIGLQVILQAGFDGPGQQFTFGAFG
jgi:hypothetical protein